MLLLTSTVLHCELHQHNVMTLYIPPAGPLARLTNHKPLTNVNMQFFNAVQFFFVCNSLSQMWMLYYLYICTCVDLAVVLEELNQYRGRNHQEVPEGGGG